MEGNLHMIYQDVRTCYRPRDESADDQLNIFSQRPIVVGGQGSLDRDELFIASMACGRATTEG